MELEPTTHFQFFKPDEVFTYCSAALIACTTISPADKLPRLCYSKIDVQARTQSPVHEVDLVDMAGLPRQAYGFEVIPKVVLLSADRLCCVGFEANTLDPLDIKRGVCRRLCLLVFKWSKLRDDLVKIASAVIEIRDMEIVHLPKLMDSPRVVMFKKTVNFFRHNKRLFSIFYPMHMTCVIVHCQHGSKFVPVTGNRPWYPGLFVFGEGEYLEMGHYSRTGSSHLYIVKVLDRTPHGRGTYQICRLLIK